MSDDDAQTFSTHEVAQAVGASLRQLQWWDERGILKPTRGRHQARRYTELERNDAEGVIFFRRRRLSLARSVAAVSEVRKVFGNRLIDWKNLSAIRVDRPTILGQTVVIPDCPTPKPRYIKHKRRANR